MSFLGRHIAVDYSLLKDLHVDFDISGVNVKVNARGSIMESAKVFEKMRVEVGQRELLVTVYSSLVFWNKKGSPDFSTSVDVTLPPGRYDVFYRSTPSKPVRLGVVSVQ
jgi:hypothetical protein